MTRVVDGPAFQEALVEVCRACPRATEAIDGLRELLRSGPENYPMEPGTKVRVATARAFPGVEHLRCVYSYDAPSDTVSLLHVAVVP
jgi:hypothetical protein